MSQSTSCVLPVLKLLARPLKLVVPMSKGSGHFEHAVDLHIRSAERHHFGSHLTENVVWRIVECFRIQMLNTRWTKS